METIIPICKTCSVIPNCMCIHYQTAMEAETKVWVFNESKCKARCHPFPEQSLNGASSSCSHHARNHNQVYNSITEYRFKAKWFTTIHHIYKNPKQYMLTQKNLHIYEGGASSMQIGNWICNCLNFIYYMIKWYENDFSTNFCNGAVKFTINSRSWILCPIAYLATTFWAMFLLFQRFYFDNLYYST